MNDKMKKFGIWSGSILLGLYLLFLLLPFVLSPVIDSYSDKIEDIVAKTTGLEVDLDDISVVTAPNLSAGIKVKNVELSLPDKKDSILNS